MFVRPLPPALPRRHLSLHDALPIFAVLADASADPVHVAYDLISQAEHDPEAASVLVTDSAGFGQADERSEEHTSELQSRFELVCRLLPEKQEGLQSTRTPRSVQDSP